MRGVAWKEEHLSLLDPDVSELSLVHHAKQHAAFVLIKPFFRLVHMIIVPLVRTSDNHDRIVRTGIQAEVVDGRLKEVGVLGKPFGEVDWWWKRHFGGLVEEKGVKFDSRACDKEAKDVKGDRDREEKDRYMG